MPPCSNAVGAGYAVVNLLSFVVCERLRYESTVYIMGESKQMHSSDDA